MKKYMIALALAILVIGGITYAATPKTIQEAMAAQGISYISYVSGGGMRIGIQAEGITPKDICEMASHYPKDNVVQVSHSSTQVTAYCN